MAGCRLRRRWRRQEQAQTLPPAPALTVPGGEEAPPIIDSGTTGDTGATGPTDTGSGSSAAGGGSGGTPARREPAAPPPSAAAAEAEPRRPSSTPRSGHHNTQPGNGAEPGASQKGVSEFCKQNPGAC